MTDICYVISHGFAARMILHSDVIPALKTRGVSVAIVTPNAGEEPIREFAARHDILLEKLPSPAAKRLQFYGRIRPYLYENVRANPALWAKHLAAVAKAQSTRQPLRRLQPHAYLLLNALAVRSRFTRDLCAALEQSLLADATARQLIRRLKPGLLVSTYPVDPAEATLLLAAERESIPTVGQLLSWDNITSKGRFTVVPRFFATWGPIMSAELREYYRIEPENIVETGVAHFDVHASGKNERAIRDAVTALGLDPDRPYLLFGMMSPYFTPYEIEVVEWLAGAVEADRFGPEIQLVVRPHPQNVEGYMADTSWLPRLDALVSPRVAIDYPILQASSLMWNMNERDLPKLASLIAGCSVLLNSGSTLSIDAILHDKPVVLTLFDAGRSLPWWQSARRGGDYYHLSKMIRLGGVRVTHSFLEMEAAIKAYLSEPTLDAGGRSRVRREETGPNDGMASQRVAEALVQFLRKSKEPSGAHRRARSRSQVKQAL